MWSFALDRGSTWCARCAAVYVCPCWPPALKECMGCITFLASNLHVSGLLCVRAWLCPAALQILLWTLWPGSTWQTELRWMRLPLRLKWKGRCCALCECDACSTRSELFAMAYRGFGIALINNLFLLSNLRTTTLFASIWQLGLHRLKLDMVDSSALVQHISSSNFEKLFKSRSLT